MHGFGSRWPVLCRWILAAAFALGACAEQVTTSLQAGHDLGVACDLRALHGAQVQFMARNGRYGALEELGGAGLIDAALACGRKYKYVITGAVQGAGFSFRADPDPENKLCTRHFYVDQSGVVRARDFSPAGPADPPWVR